MRSNYDSATLPYWLILRLVPNRAFTECLCVVSSETTKLFYNIIILVHIVAPIPFLSSVPGWIRTNDLPLRRRLLYPAGLRELSNSIGGIRTHTLLILSQLTLPLVYDAVNRILSQVWSPVKSKLRFYFFIEFAIPWDDHLMDPARVDVFAYVILRVVVGIDQFLRRIRMPLQPVLHHLVHHDGESVVGLASASEKFDGLFVCHNASGGT